MSSKASLFLQKALGIDYLDSFSKSELWKPATRSTLDLEEISVALQIAPRVIMSLLIRELAGMQIGDHRDIPLPVGKNVLLRVNKHERDCFSGDVEEENKVIVDFKFRSLPGIALVIMSAFELYDVEKLADAPATIDDQSEKIQKLVDERLALHSLIGQVVDKKIVEKDAIQQLILAKITTELEHAKSKIKEEPAVSELFMPEVKIKKELPLKNFLKNRLNKNEFTIQMAKGESVDCSDCGKSIFTNHIYSGCICMGQDMNSKIFIKKSENGIKVRFSKGWDKENIQMLLEMLRSKNGK